MLAAGAEPYYVPARAKTGFLPDFASVPKAVLERTVAAFFCSPSNPEGACASAADWRALFELADAYDFTVLADECYCEIYDVAPPVGALTVRYAMTGGFERLLAFHSLSKRSSAPGLRSGFVVGPPNLIADLTALPQHFRAAGADSGARGLRRRLDGRSPCRRSRAAAIASASPSRGGCSAIKRAFACRRGSFYLWLDVGDGAAFAKALWRKTGVRVMPGAFMGVEEIPGDPKSNPGYSYVRVALVHDSLTIEAALGRVAEFLEGVD